MKISDAAYTRIKKKLWKAADEIGWPTLSDQQKSSLYEEWIRDPEVGGALSRYLDPGNIRVYIKDTIMKPYGRERIKEFSPILRLLRLPEDAQSLETYIKPHGRRLMDGKVICWGLTRDWKAILFAVFERAHLANLGDPFAAVLLFPTGKYQQPAHREMVEAASAKLGIGQVVWYEG